MRALSTGIILAVTAAIVSYVALRSTPRPRGRHRKPNTSLRDRLLPPTKPTPQPQPVIIRRPPAPSENPTWTAVPTQRTTSQVTASQVAAPVMRIPGQHHNIDIRDRHSATIKPSGGRLTAPPARRSHHAAQAAVWSKLMGSNPKP